MTFHPIRATSIIKKNLTVAPAFNCAVNPTWLLSRSIQRRADSRGTRSHPRSNAPLIRQLFPNLILLFKLRIQLFKLVCQLEQFFVVARDLLGGKERFRL